MLYAFKLGRKLLGEEPYCPEKGGKVAVLIKAQSMLLRSMQQTCKSAVQHHHEQPEAVYSSG